MEERIKATFTESIQTQISTADSLSPVISLATQQIVNSLLNGNKILACGNGGSAANAQQFVSCLINKYETERPSLPAIALTADTISLTAVANDESYEEIFAKQVRALGNKGDILLVVSSSGNSRDVLKAMEVAVTRDMIIVALSGGDGGAMPGLLGEHDVEIRVPSNRSSRIQETHMLIVHCLCDLIDQFLFSAHRD